MSPPPVGAVIFDWGGTLTLFHDIDLLDLWWMAALEISVPHAGYLTRVLARVEAEWWRRGEGTGQAGPVTDLLAAASAAVDADVAEAVLRAGARRDLAAWTPHTVCDPEALLLMHLVRARGLQVGLLTNTRWPPSWHERMLARDGLLGLLDARVYATDLAVDKPHPSAFQAVLAALGVTDPARALFVGDRPHSDIAGARAVGMRTVLLADGALPSGTSPAAAPPAAGPAGATSPGGAVSAGSVSAGSVSAGAVSAGAVLAGFAPGDSASAATASAPWPAPGTGGEGLPGLARPDAVIHRLGELLEVLDLFGAPAPGR